MTEAFWGDAEPWVAGECAERAQEALEFIVSHGGATPRWRSVIISTDAFGPHRAVADFIRSTPLPELEYFELKFQGPSEFGGEDELAFQEATIIEPLPLFRDPPSRLRTLKVKGLPNPFLFGHSNQVQLPSLTTLHLDFVDFPPRLLDVTTLLRVTSQLVVLHLTFEFTEPAPVEPNLHMPKTHLRYLREFGLLHVKEGLWPANFLMGLEAPNVDFLQIGVVECEIGSSNLVEYLADGGDKTNPRPVFPSVTHLKAWLGGRHNPTKLLKALLRAHPRITLLEIPFIPKLDALLVKPWLAPGLQHLRAIGSTGSELKKVVGARTKAKLPLRMVDADTVFGRTIRFVEPFGDHRVADDVPSEDEDNSFACFQRSDD
ncbi:hypothetical protein FRC10_002183 [Ceratobasidium sp. 414]|nr:hypothetical protein FRC10_002183 [Ceratobasidium sp. 414]